MPFDHCDGNLLLAGRPATLIAATDSPRLRRICGRLQQEQSLAMALAG
jgi:hypothetical protein